MIVANSSRVMPPSPSWSKIAKARCNAAVELSYMGPTASTWGARPSLPNLHVAAAAWPRRVLPRIIHVAAAASLRPASTEFPRRGHVAATATSPPAEYPRRNRGVAAIHQRNVHAANVRTHRS